MPQDRRGSRINAMNLLIPIVRACALLLLFGAGMGSGQQAAPVLSALNISATSVLGSVTATGNTVVLTDAAPDGGAVVQLTSSDPAAAAPPASVVVAAGQRVSPAFDIATAVVAADETVTITASYNGSTRTDTLALRPLAIISVSLSPTSVTGGATTTWNGVKLNAPAPPGGALVMLTSSNPAVASVPNSVLVPAGSTNSPPFAITTSAVGVSTPVTITATYNGGGMATVLTVMPPVLSALNVAPTSVVGGLAAARNTVVLTGAAPAGGVVVQLTSSDPASAAAPASVMVPAGSSTSAMFAITTSAVAVSTPVTITATYNGESKEAALTITAAAVSALRVASSSVIGGVTATGNTVTLTGVAPAGGAVVQLTSSDPAAVLPPGSVIVAAGQSVSPAFQIGTTLVSATEIVTITATYNGVSKTDTLTVTPLAVSAVTLSPTTVAGGSATTWNGVTLNAVAPSAGALVMLASSDPAVVSVPASVSVPAGSRTSPLFTITTTAVTVSTDVTITATYNGGSIGKLLTVAPTVLSTLNVAATSVVGGVTATLNTVTLTGVAPDGGAVVQLTSSNPAAVLPPASVVVAAGQRVSPSFNIVTGVVAATTTVTVTASYNGVSKTDTLTVTPSSIAALTLSPTAVTGGSATTWNGVKLDAAAPATGAVVTISSSDPSVASVPDSVVVPAGSTNSPVFTINTSAVAVSTPVTITATYNGTTQGAVLTVLPPVLSALSIASTSLMGGAASTLNTVSLSGVAPAGGAGVQLASSDPAASVPASVVVPAGSKTSPAFAINTSAVAVSTPVTITATYGGVSKQATVSVLPPVLSALRVAPTSLVGGVTATGNTVVLAGAAPPGGAVVQLTSSDPAAVVPPASVVIAAGQTVSPAFNITTNIIAVGETVTITATYNGISKTDTLTVTPLAISAVMLSPTTVTGGSTTTWNGIKLNAPAPNTGAVVMLTSSDPAAVVPASIIVPAGSNNSPVFTITTTAVGVSTPVTITATYNGGSQQAVLTIAPAVLSALSLATTVVGGVTATGNTVTLSGVAPFGGAVVQLISSDPATAVPPASVVIPAGSRTSPFFTITTTAVAVSTPVTVTANYNGASTQAVMTVAAAGLSTLKTASTSVFGGVTITGNTVSLSGVAPAGGAVVQLTSSDPVTAAPPPSVTVAAGQSVSPPFDIITTAVAISKTVTITATYNEVSQTATLSVGPLGISLVTLSPSSVTGGGATTGNSITLNAEPPPGGAVATLASSNPAVASVPATAVVSTGSMVSLPFTITTTAVTASTLVTITATYNGASKQAVLTVTPPGVSSGDITLYVNTDSTAGGDCTTSSTDPADPHRACANLATASHLLPADLTTVGIATIWCAGSQADTSKPFFNGHHTDATHYIQIATKPEDRHDGVWDETKYRIVSTDYYALNLWDAYVRVDGLQLRNVNPTGIRQLIAFLPTTGAQDGSEYRISNSILRGSNDPNYAQAVFATGAYANVIAWNLVGYDLYRGAPGLNWNWCYRNFSTGSLTIYSSTFYGGSMGFRNPGSAPMTLKNVYVNSAGTDIGLGVNITTVATGDQTGTLGLRGVAATTANFVNVTPGSEDWHLVFGSALIGAGTNTSDDPAPLNFTIDIDGQSRGSIWDIGADQYVASSPPAN